MGDSACRQIGRVGAVSAGWEMGGGGAVRLLDGEEGTGVEHFRLGVEERDRRREGRQGRGGERCVGGGG